MRINNSNYYEPAFNFFISYISLFLSLLIFLFLPYHNIHADSFSNVIEGIAEDNSKDIQELEDLDKILNSTNDSSDFSDSEESSEDINSLKNISSTYSIGTSFNFGSQITRERLGISFLKILSEKIRYSIKISYGKWDRIEIKYEDNDYDVVSKNFGSNINLFYYPNFFFPIYLNIATGYYYWKGDITPVSLVVNEEQSQDPNLKSDFHLHTLMVSSSIGWDFYFGNGWFIQHCLFGIGSVFTLSSDFSDNEVSDTKSELKHKLAKPYMFGPLNIGIGKLF